MYGDCDDCDQPGLFSAVLDARLGNCRTEGLRILPSQVYFGTLVVGESDFTPQIITVTNQGKGPIRIVSVQITVGGSNFTLAGNTSYPDVLVGNESFDIEIAATMFSSAGTATGVLEIRTNEDRISYAVNISGRIISAPGWDQILQDIYGDFSALVQEEAWARADGISAEAGHRLTLEANINGQMDARFIAEQTARVTQYEAEVTNRTVGIASLRSDTEASFVIEQNARTTQYEAEAASRIALRAELRGDYNAQFDEERLVRSTTIDQVAEDLTTLSTSFTGQLNDTNAQISNEISARTTAISAEASRVNDLLTQLTRDGGTIDTKVSAGISSEASARSTQIAAEASRVDTLFANYETKGGVDAKVSAAITTEQSVRSGADSALSTRVDTLEASVINGGGGGIDSYARSAITAEQTARADADNALATRATKLESQYSGAGNLLSNTAFVTTDGWQAYNTVPGAVVDAPNTGINTAGPSWHPIGENVLTIHQNGVGGYPNQYMGWETDMFPVHAGEILQFYAFTASHRSSRSVVLYFFNDQGGTISGIQSDIVTQAAGTGGIYTGGYYQSGVKAFQVPDNAVQARLQLRKFDTNPGEIDSWSFFWRPYVGYARLGQTEWNPYAPGSGAATQSTLLSRITTEESARSTADLAAATAQRTLLAQMTAKGAGFVNRNPDFTVWPDGQILPSGWGQWDWAHPPTRTALPDGGYCYDQAVGYEVGQTAAGIYCDGATTFPGFNNPLMLNPPMGWYVAEIDFQLIDGGMSGAGVLIYMLDINGGLLDQKSIIFSNSNDISGSIPTFTVGKVYKYRILFQSAVPNVYNLRLYAMTGWANFNPIVATKTLRWLHCGIRPASEGEVKGQKADTALNTPGTGLIAKVQTNESAIATANGKLSSYWKTQAVAGNNRAQLSIWADANAGAGVDIIGDVSISGNLVVDGSVTFPKVKINDFTRSASAIVNGTYDPAPGSGPIIIPLFTMLGINPGGIWTTDLSSAVYKELNNYSLFNNQTQTWTDFIFDDDGGLSIYCTDNQGNTYFAKNGYTDILATTPFDAHWIARIENKNNYSDSGQPVGDPGTHRVVHQSQRYSVSAINFKARWSTL